MKKINCKKCKRLAKASGIVSWYYCGHPSNIEIDEDPIKKTVNPSKFCNDFCPLTADTKRNNSLQNLIYWAKRTFLWFRYNNAEFDLDDASIQLIYEHAYKLNMSVDQLFEKLLKDFIERNKNEINE